MLFEVFNAQGVRVMWTEHEKAIPSKEELRERAKTAGFKYKLDGKPYKVGREEKPVLGEQVAFD